MTIPASILSEEQARVIRDNEPTFSNRQGVDLPTLLNDFAAAVKAEAEKITSGEAVVLDTTDNVVVAVGAEFDGLPAVATLAEADGAIHVLHAVWDGSGNLTITTSAVVTADRTVYYIVDGR